MFEILRRLTISFAVVGVCLGPAYIMLGFNLFYPVPFDLIKFIHISWAWVWVIVGVVEDDEHINKTRWF